MYDSKTLALLAKDSIKGSFVDDRIKTNLRHTNQGELGSS